MKGRQGSGRGREGGTMREWGSGGEAVYKSRAKLDRIAKVLRAGFRVYSLGYMCNIFPILICLSLSLPLASNFSVLDCVNVEIFPRPTLSFRRNKYQYTIKITF